jgi:hypothetical protein
VFTVLGAVAECACAQCRKRGQNLSSGMTACAGLMSFWLITVHTSGGMAVALVCHANPPRNHGGFFAAQCTGALLDLFHKIRRRPLRALPVGAAVLGILVRASMR